MEAPATVPVVPLSVFLSHASADRDLAGQFAQALEAAGYSAWLAEDAIGAGDNYAEVIYGALTKCNIFVLLLSSAAVNSPHVKREINIAIDRKKKILPFWVETSLATPNELPLDWRYWLGVVQIEPFTSVPIAVQLIADRFQPVTRPLVSGRHQIRDATLATVDAATEVRQSLIQTAAQGQTFGNLVMRLRATRLPRDVIFDHVERFRDNGLVTYEDPLEDSTTIQLAT